MKPVTSAPLHEDHPRMRGEHGETREIDNAELGIIPACAGSTTVSVFGSSPSEGSSPHARGAPS